uniref:PH domain-containing protein n=1 Tax=Haptolina brevifila TaxID=156173 RepID=A0A7S2E2X8_9EUKA|mmetsp:Transcript_47444/g.94705  ORF Transcript_47444/g.94705 Transcript_47444/m.94705 type:complete len:188 (+) Transcript_47444:86-649(+)
MPARQRSSRLTATGAHRLPGEPSVPEGEVANDPKLTSWLKKRHGTTEGIAHGEKVGWAKRLVSVDDYKGRLSYSNRDWLAAGQMFPSLVLPLQDVTSVRALPSIPDGKQQEQHCFEVACAPYKLVLSVDAEDEMHRWVTALSRRVDHWRRKAAEIGPLSAVPTFRRRGEPWRIIRPGSSSGYAVAAW